jgi:hypothetical protein
MQIGTLAAVVAVVRSTVMHTLVRLQGGPGPAPRSRVGGSVARVGVLALLLGTAAGPAGAAAGPAPTASGVPDVPPSAAPASSTASSASPSSSAPPSPGPSGSAPASAADSAQACLESYDLSQRLRQQAKLVAARSELLRCSQEICPSVIKSDCLPWLAEVERSLPSIVVAAKDVEGRDTTSVRVLIDGKLVAPTLDGRPIPLDPGTHHLHFEHGAAPAIEQDIVVHVGVKDRPIEVSFAPKGATPVGGSATQGKETGLGDASAEREEPVAGYVLTGFGVLGLGSFALFGLMGKGEADTYDETCAPTKTCSEDEVSATRTKLLVADVSLGVGLAALGVGIGLILYNKLSGPDEPVPSARVDLGPLPGGAAGALTLRF